MLKIATIGFFDGVHKGHQFLFEHLRALADERGLEPLIITFDIHPRAALQADYVPRLLTTPEEREVLLSRYGEVKMLSFLDVQPLTAAAFMDKMHTEYGVTTLLMGYDHRFGSDRLQHPNDYRRIGAEHGIEVVTMGEFVEGEWHVSSTEIRAALETGNIVVANDLLGRPYGLTGTVVHGKGLGHTIGFPTANIVPLNPHQIVPKTGVYMAKVHTPTMDNAPAFVNIDKQGLIEAYIPSFKGDLYGAQLRLRFVRFLREEKKFENLEELREQIRADVDNIRRLV